MTDPTTALREVLALSNKERDAEENREYGVANDLYAELQVAAVNLIRTHGPALLSALEDARRLRHLMDDACVEGFVGVDGDVHDFASCVADGNKREEPNADDCLEGFRRMIDAAIASLSAPQPSAETQPVAVFNCPNCPAADLSEAARRAADAIDVLLPLLSSEQREVVCDAIAEADEARADILRALAAQQPAADPLVEWANSPLNFTATVGEFKDGVRIVAENDLIDWRAAFIAERATRCREGGMKIEQARIHAETDATLMEQIARQQQGGES